MGALPAIEIELDETLAACNETGILSNLAAVPSRPERKRDIAKIKLAGAQPYCCNAVVVGRITNHIARGCTFESSDARPAA